MALVNTWVNFYQIYSSNKDVNKNISVFTENSTVDPTNFGNKILKVLMKHIDSIVIAKSPVPINIYVHHSITNLGGS